MSRAASGQSALVGAEVCISGNVQGVGFRPFLYRLALEHGLRGSVANTVAGVDVEVEGPRDRVAAFLSDIRQRCPPIASISELSHRFTQPFGRSAFIIADSQNDGHRTAQIPADMSVCDDCLREFFDPADRRFLYPFINCTNCGPRFTIIREVPYDRATTSMDCFTMCPACQAEFTDPENRRFHAQPNACPKCGPRVWLVQVSRDGLPVGRISNPSGTEGNSVLCEDENAIESAAQMLQAGAIVAVKGLGGFHLACDATNTTAVDTLRERKNREKKPFAIMVPHLQAAQQLCHLDADAELIITSRERPITILPSRFSGQVARSVAFGHDCLGLMLPYTPLHYRLLFDKSRQPRFRALVMTSGNLSDEPIAIGNREAFQRLREVADAFLFHDRDILVRADDSVVRCVSAGKPITGKQLNAGNTSTIIRRSRGYVPAPVFLDRDVGEVLAVGGHLKNTVAISRGRMVFLSQHIGDLDNLEALESFRQSVDHLQQILGIRPTVVAYDLHPGYLTTRFARELDDVRLVPVQHHHAHVAACMAENGLNGPVIGVALDGTGYGTDGNIWGGEFLVADYDHFERVAHFREVPMPGSEQAIRQPWRMALSYLDAAFGDGLWDLPVPFVRQLDRPTAELLMRAARRGINSPLTSSCGRLFDAVAALLGLRQVVTYEGQAAMELEMAMHSRTMQNAAPPDSSLALEQSRDNSCVTRACAADHHSPLLLDSTELIRAVVADIQAQVPVEMISQRFHTALVQSLAEIVGRVAHNTGIRDVALSGGCFQNRFLQQELTTRLLERGLSVYGHRLIPPNDGGLALGQLVVGASGVAR